MAKMIDKIPDYDGEKKTWECFSANLPQQYVVYNTRSIKGWEFDFCIMAEGVGLFIVEVKGWRATADAVVDIVSDIAMITFTKDAAENMNSRLKRMFMNYFVLTSNEKYMHLIEDMSQIQISTIHKFAISLLHKECMRMGIGFDSQISSETFDRRQLYHTKLDAYLSEKAEENPDFVHQLTIPSFELESLIKKYDDKLLEDKTRLTDYVPYRLIKPFVDKEGKNLIDKKGNYSRFIAYLNAFVKLDNEFFYDIIFDDDPLKRRIHINEEWREFMMQNYAVIMGWIRYNKAIFIQDRNPGVPGVMYKIAPEVEAKHKSLL